LNQIYKYELLLKNMKFYVIKQAAVFQFLNSFLEIGIKKPGNSGFLIRKMPL